MKIVIVYSSTYLGNTRKIAVAMAVELSADVVDIDKTQDLDLTQYDLIGLGSSIHFAQHDIRLMEFVEKQNISGLNVFIFSTRCRPFLGGYHSNLKKLLKQKQVILVGEFSCVGFDRTGPWVIIDGYNKNRPNDKDLFKARLFASKMKRKTHPLSQISESPIIDSCKNLQIRECGGNVIMGNIVCLNLTSCIECGKCIKLCPMNVFEKQIVDGKCRVVPTSELHCIQCSKCYNECPTDAIYINESFKNGLRIAIWEVTNNKLQNGYKAKKHIGYFSKETTDIDKL